MGSEERTEAVYAVQTKSVSYICIASRNIEHIFAGLCVQRATLRKRWIRAMATTTTVSNG